MNLYDRAWFHEEFGRIFRGWFRVLEETSGSFAVWQPRNGITLPSFTSTSGLQCDGVARMWPALAAWTAGPENPGTLSTEDGREVDPREILFRGLVNGTDPKHRDFWQLVPTRNQRQVEASIIAWSIWLARDWLIPRLSGEQTRNVQNWLASCAVFTDHTNNWSLFTAVNEAVRHALGEHGFEGSPVAVRRDLIAGDELHVGDGWMFDKKYSNIDYYNFWVFGSHHCYLRAILPGLENAMLDRALRKLSRRLQDLPYLIDARGRNVLFGRSLPYRWGWLNGLAAAHFIGLPSINPGLARAMLARNLQAWREAGSYDENGVLRERLTPAGSAGGSSTYINCGHPYWGMQAFLCLAIPEKDPFWQTAARPFPVEERDFLIPRQGPGFVFQGFRQSGEVRLHSLRNLHPGGSALYDKFVYSPAFPCNSDTTAHRTTWDNQFALRLADGSSVNPSENLLVDTHDGRSLCTIRRFALQVPGNVSARVETRIEVDGESCLLVHLIEVESCDLENAVWVEGGFVLPLLNFEDLRQVMKAQTGTAESISGHQRITTSNLGGWENLHPADRWKEACPLLKESNPNIIAPFSVHFLLTAPVSRGRVVLTSRHRASQRPGPSPKA